MTSIIKEDEEIVGVVEEVFMGARYNGLKSLRKIKAKGTG